MKGKCIICKKEKELTHWDIVCDDCHYNEIVERDYWKRLGEKRGWTIPTR